MLRQTLPRIGPDVRLGLASFGHRRRGNCSDAEVIVPPEPGNLERIMTPLDRMNATGKGPLVLGLREAAAAIGTAAPATIVLIHDDVDNCGQDVCAAASDIAAANPGLAVHTIGLGLDKAKLQQMSCVARLTGGKIYDAQDATGSRRGARPDHQACQSGARSAKPSPRRKRLPRPPLPSRPRDAPPGLYLSAGLGPKSATLESPVRWRVTKAGAEGEVIRETTAPALVEKLPPGTYEVEARLGLAAAHQSVDVKPEGPTPVRVNLNAGVLKMLARPAKAAPPLQNPVFTVTALSDGASKRPPRPYGSGARRSLRSCCRPETIGSAPRTASRAKSRRSRSRPPPGPPSMPCWRPAVWSFPQRAETAPAKATP